MIYLPISLDILVALDSVMFGVNGLIRSVSVTAESEFNPDDIVLQYKITILTLHVVLKFTINTLAFSL